MRPQYRDVLEEVTAEDLPREHVVRRIDDWAERIGKLYDRISGWLPGDIKVDRSDTISMSSNIMTATGVTSRSLPVFRGRRGQAVALTIEPEGLWIVGANGRLKAYGAGGFAHIVDRAKNFQQPKWEIAFSPDRHTGHPLTKDTILRLI